MPRCPEAPTTTRLLVLMFAVGCSGGSAPEETAAANAAPVPDVAATPREPAQAPARDVIVPAAAQLDRAIAECEVGGAPTEAAWRIGAEWLVRLSERSDWTNPRLREAFGRCIVPASRLGSEDRVAPSAYTRALLFHEDAQLRRRVDEAAVLGDAPPAGQPPASLWAWMEARCAGRASTERCGTRLDGYGVGDETHRAIAVVTVSRLADLPSAGSVASIGWATPIVLEPEGATWVELAFLEDDVGLSKTSYFVGFELALEAHAIDEVLRSGFVRAERRTWIVAVPECGLQTFECTAAEARHAGCERSLSGGRPGAFSSEDCARSALVIDPHSCRGDRCDLAAPPLERQPALRAEGCRRIARAALHAQRSGLVSPSELDSARLAACRDWAPRFADEATRVEALAPSYARGLRELVGTLTSRHTHF